MLKLSIIVPVFNEIQYLDTFTNRLFNTFKDENIEYIFINDGSNDGSKEKLETIIKNFKDKNILLINVKNNIGKGNALQQGIKVSTGTHMLFQDADLELDTRDSLEMFKIIKNDKNIACVFGSRYLSGKLKKNNNYLNEVVVKFNSLIFNILFFQSLSDLHCGTKIISKEIIDKINLSITDFGFEIDIAAQIAKNDYDIYEYGISYFSRSKKEGKKITWVDGLKSYYYLFKTRFIQNPFSTNLSIIFSSIYMVYVGSFFGMGIGKDILMILFLIIGLFIGLYRKLFYSSIIFLLIFFGSLFSQGNGKIYTILLAFFIAIYLTKKLKKYFNKKINNNLINFFI